MVAILLHTHTKKKKSFKGKPYYISNIENYRFSFEGGDNSTPKQCGALTYIISYQ